jgi:hypothetical protein
VKERNVEISNLKKEMKYSQDVADIEFSLLMDQHSAEIEDLAEEINSLAKTQNQKLTLTTYSARAYTNQVRELYYSLLSLKLPPAQIKTVVLNVIKHQFPLVTSDYLANLALPICVHMRCPLYATSKSQLSY